MTVEQFDMIVHRLRTGDSYRYIAYDTGIPASTIDSIRLSMTVPGTLTDALRRYVAGDLSVPVRFADVKTLVRNYDAARGKLYV